MIGKCRSSEKSAAAPLRSAAQIRSFIRNHSFIGLSFTERLSALNYRSAAQYAFFNAWDAGIMPLGNPKGPVRDFLMANYRLISRAYTSTFPGQHS